MTSVGVGAPDRESQVDAGRRGWRRSKWIGFTFVPLGLLSWMAFLYAGIGARVRRWQAWAGFYFGVAVAAWVLLSAAGRAPRGHHSHDAVAAIGFLLLLAVWIGSIIHAVAIRRRYLNVYTRDGYDFPPARKPLVRLLKPLNDRFARGATTSIPLNLLPASPDDVIGL